MNRNDFMWLLECSLLVFDGMTKEDLIKFGANEKDAEAGIRLCNYLKSIEIKSERQNDKESNETA